VTVKIGLNGLDPDLDWNKHRINLEWVVAKIGPEGLDREIWTKSGPNLDLIWTPSGPVFQKWLPKFPARYFAHVRGN
jgi:hypothetical protein